MGDVINIEENLPHTVSEVICVKCGHRWVSVRPDTVFLKELECPNGGKGYVIETRQILEREDEG